MTKRELNKKLKTKTLEIRNSVGIKDGIVRVIRAREVNDHPFSCFTEVDIKIYAQIESALGEYENLNHYGPKAVRNFLRRRESKVDQTVSNWVKLWGFSQHVKIKSIELIPIESDFFII